MIGSRKNFIVFGSPTIGSEEIEEVVASIKTGWLGTGPKVMQFENEFCAYKTANYAIAVNSCTAALHLSLLAANLQPGDEVITTPLTFCATVNSIIHVGATPVLADIDPITMNIDPQQVVAKITPRTKAIILVHFAGRPCNMNALSAIATEHNLIVIEDCAHAIETEYKGSKAGTFGDYGCFSFYVTKNITTGEGGMVITPHQQQSERMKILGLHGMSKDAWKRFSDDGYVHYQVVEPGFKYNMMDIQAAIGIHQLRRVHSYWKRRQEIWQQYNQAFSDLPLTLPAEPEPDTIHAYHLYTVLVDQQVAGINRDQFLMAMYEQSIGTGVHYQCIPEHPYYQKALQWHPEDFPHAMKIGRRTASLPLSAKLSDQDVDRVIEAVMRCLL